MELLWVDLEAEIKMDNAVKDGSDYGTWVTKEEMEFKSFYLFIFYWGYTSRANENTQKFIYRGTE